MGGYIIRRLFQAVLVLVGVSLVVFLMLRLSGDPAVLLLPPEATYEDVDRLRHELGLDQPLYVQCLRFLAGVARGDFGESLRSRQPALPLVLERLPATIELTLAAMLISVVVAFPVGMVSALKRNSPWDRASMFLALAGQSLPSFWLGIMFILVFAVQFRLLPPAGRGGWEYLVMPAITLSMFSLGRTTRLVRSGMIDILTEDYIRTARSKGLRELVVVSRHALKPAMIPIVTVLGLDVATLLGGAVITEQVFAWPGVGRLAVTAIYGRDYPVVQAAVFVVSTTYVLVNLAVDVLYGYLDPRIRLS